MPSISAQVKIDTAALQERLRHVYWIGGGSGAGKSTIARCIAAAYDMHYYATDDVMADHGRRMPAETSPYLQAFIAMDMDERWLHRSPKVMLESFHWFRGEGFALIIEDLLQLPSERSIVVEGFRLLPHLLMPLLANPAQAIWLLPTPTFRQHVFAERGGVAWGFIGKTSHPAQALHNLLERDARFTERLRAELEQDRLPYRSVDGTLSVADLTAQVATAFGLPALPSAPNELP
ncbi:MAG: hypothetical protein Fur005_49490 [Roseiflexaceae bacterium]